jgi:hypothetical protein
MDAAVSLCAWPRPPPPISRSFTSASVRQTSDLHGLGVGVHVGQHGLHHLEVADRLAELHPRAA